MLLPNPSNNTYWDLIREPSGGGILRAAGKPYLDALGGFEFIFYTVLIAMTMGIVYQRTNDIYMPLFVLMLAGVLMSSLLSPDMRNLGNLLVALAFTAILISTIWRKK